MWGDSEENAIVAQILIYAEMVGKYTTRHIIYLLMQHFIYAYYILTYKLNTIIS